MKSEFLTELAIMEAPDDGKWILEKPLVYASELLGKTVEVPAGFVTDFASVPRVPVAYMLFGDRAHREAVIHDYLYQTNMVKKSIADKVFLEAMKCRNKGWWIRWPMYLGVVLGGGSSYDSGPKRYTVLNTSVKGESNG